MTLRIWVHSNYSHSPVYTKKCSATVFTWREDQRQLIWTNLANFENPKKLILIVNSITRLNLMNNMKHNCSSQYRRHITYKSTICIMKDKNKIKSEGALFVLVIIEKSNLKSKKQDSITNIKLMKKLNSYQSWQIEEDFHIFWEIPNEHCSLAQAFL